MAPAGVEDVLNPGDNIFDAFRQASEAALSLSSNACEAALREAAEEEVTNNLRDNNLRANNLRDNNLRANNLRGEPDSGVKTELAAKVMEARTKLGTRKFQEMWRYLLEHSDHVFPEVAVTYRDLQIEAVALVGDSAIDSISNSLKKLFSICSPLNQEKVNLIHKTSGIIHPGRATLVLGPPGAGKSLFMKTVTGRVSTTPPNLTISGSICYDGVPIEKLNAQRTAAYVDQEDNHLPVLTVQETLEFAFNCLADLRSGDGNRAATSVVEAAKESLAKAKDLLGRGITDCNDVKIETADGEEAGAESRAEHQDEFAQKIDQSLVEALEGLVAVLSEANQYGSKAASIRVHVWLAYLGLTVCKDTIVGNALLRGVSGGQRKRVTSGEFLVGGASVLMMDEISTGLDSATTFSICQHLAESCRVFRNTTVISLLQPPPETVNLFDDIMLFAEGRLIFHGPNADVIPFFKSLGFDCPPRKDPASFLQEVTTIIGQNEYANSGLRAEKGLSPLDETSPLLPQMATELLVSTEEIEQKFWQSETGKALRGDFDKAVGKDKSASASQREGTKAFPGILYGKYASTSAQQLVTVLNRQVTLTTRSRATTIGRLIQCLVMGVFSGLLYSTIEKSAANSRSFLGVLFTMISYLAMGNTSQVQIIQQGREVFFKQRDNCFFRSVIYVVSMTITQIPITVLEVIFYTMPVYFIVGLYPTAVAYLTLWAICFITSCALASLFRAISAFSKDMVMANSVMSLIILMLILTSGFAIVKGSIPPWWIWIYWISPFSWAFRAAAQNEFLSTDPTWSSPSGTFEDACGGECTTGQAVLLTFDMPLDSGWVGYGLLFNLGVFLFGTVLCSVGMQVTKKPQQQATVSASSDSDLPAADLQLTKATQASRLGLSTATGLSAAVGTTAGRSGAAGSALPFQPLTLCWKDIHYFVPFPKGKDSKDAPEELELLKGVTGYSQPGTLTALMGGSGAGKTTFMDVIAGRKTVGRITGEILVNGHPKVQETWARVCGYVEQMDIHIPYCTVKEALTFSANLRLDPKVTREQAKAYVSEVMTMVDLWPIANRTIGMPGGEGLSLEQRKRVTIGVELVANPGVIFMDEPTSGLDAKAAATVVRAVRNIGTSGRTIMVTIHQPSIEIFEAFDQLLLLQKGGYTIYFGNIGVESADLVAYFRTYKGVEPVPVGYNPATWMLEVSGGAPQTLIAAAPYNFADEWVENQVSKEVEARAGEISATCLKEASPVNVEGVYAQGFFVQLAELYGRVNIMYWRNPSYNLTRWVLAVVYACMFGSLYWQQGDLVAQANANGGVLSITSVSNILGISYAGCIFLGLGNLITAIPVVSLGRSVFYRERSVSMYSVLPYAIASAVIEVPYIVLQVGLFVPIMYAMVGFPIGSGAFVYWLVMYVASLSTFTFFGQLLVYMTPSPMLAQILSGAINFFWNIFSGYSIPVSLMPTYLAWINRIAPTTWVIYGLVVSQLGNQDIPMYAFGDVVPVSQYIEEYFGYSYAFRWYCVVIVGAFAVGFMLSGAGALWKLNFNVR